MGRLNIKLAENVHAALKHEATRRKCSMGSIVEESLRMAGVLAGKSGSEVVAKARASARLRGPEADAIALRETAAHRSERR